jgi:hypothetical protein
MAAADNSSRITLGPPETVLADQAFGLRAFPDGRLAVVRTKPDCRVILAAGVSSTLLEGSAMGKFTKAMTVLERGKAGEFDNGYAGINSVWRARSGELLALYHAEDQEGMETVGGGIPGFFCRVALAASHDDGLTFEKRGPVLSSQSPKNPKGPPDQGVGEPWLLAEPKGEYLYAYYTSHERADGRSVDIGLARCRVGDALQPEAWQKFHADSFDEPGLAGKDTPVLTSSQRDADVLLPQVVFIPERHEFMMIFCLNAWREGGNANRSGFYVAFSPDGIHWPGERQPAEQRQLIWKVPVVAREGFEVAWHPTFIPDEVGGTRGWLYYGYSERWGWKPPDKPHYLVRRRLEIAPSSPQTP